MKPKSLTADAVIADFFAANPTIASCSVKTSIDVAAGHRVLTLRIEVPLGDPSAPTLQ